MTTSLDSDDNVLVNLMVPKRYYTSMIQTLATLMQGDQPVGRLDLSTLPWPTEGEAPRVHDIDWTNVENCRRLRKHLKNNAALTLLGLAADRAGNPVYISEVMERAQCTHGQASSGNGAITKAVRMVFNSKSEWPAPFNWDKEKGIAYYVMTVDVAKAWKASEDKS